MLGLKVFKRNTRLGGTSWDTTKVIKLGRYRLRLVYEGIITRIMTRGSPNGCVKSSSSS